MKNIFYFFLLCFVIACANEPKSVETPKVVESAKETPEAAATTETIGETPTLGTKFKPKNAPGMTEPKNVIANGIWVIEGYIAIGEDNAQKNNQGRWFNFTTEGSYERGRFGEKNGSGKWTYDEKANLLTLEDSDASQNMQFNANITPSGETIIIIGTNRYNQTHIQGKMVVQENYPTKAQFNG